MATERTEPASFGLAGGMPTAFLIAAACFVGASSTSLAADEPPASSGREAPIGESYRVVAEASYYLNGPQQGRPPDGTFAEGAKVTLIRTAGSYALVRSADGIRAYVAADAIRPAGTGDDLMDPDLIAVVEGNTRFAIDLYHRLRSEEAGNLFFSPASLSTALAMTYAGAAGETAEQMAEVLRFSLPAERLHPAFAALQRLATDADADAAAGIRLAVANRLWGQRDFDFRADFLALTRDSYGAELAPVEFAREPERVRQQINAWVADRTGGKIADLLAPGALDAMTRLVLTNAVHFKGDWSEPFRKEATKDAPFHLSADRRADVPLMHRQGRYPYGEADGMKILAMPYGDGSRSMVVLLPVEVDGLADLEAGLTVEALDRRLSGLREREVRVEFPRFSMASHFQLAEQLGAMGMDRAFSPGRADFSGMSTEEELCLSAVIHKAFIDVNEEGTEAAAATGVAVAATSFRIPPEPATFRADHPFLFLIRDDRTGSILFLGRLVDPRP